MSSQKQLKSATLLCISVFLLPNLYGSELALELDEAINIAQESDPWLDSSRFTEQSLRAEAISMATLPDPKLSLSVANLPTDTFDLDQEAMTQLKLGVSQMFPRGRSRSLRSEEKIVHGLQQTSLRSDRRAKIGATVTALWLDVFKAQQTIALIENDRFLFEQLVDVADASYSSALGSSRQQNVIRAQLELTRLEDRLSQLRLNLDSNRQKLGEWVGAFSTAKSKDGSLPVLVRSATKWSRASAPTAETKTDRLANHPAISALDKAIEALDIRVDLARQKYKPEWGLSAQYGYRDSDANGNERADLFSVGVTLDLPVFTKNRQDQGVAAALAKAASLKSKRNLSLRKLVAKLDTSESKLLRISERRSLFEEKLLPQMSEQAEAALSAYDNDTGDFAEAVRARIAELNAKIELLEIKTEQQKVVAEMNYLLTRSYTTGVTKNTLENSK